MKELKKIQLHHGETGWVYHLMDEINSLLDEYGMGVIFIENDEMYFQYYEYNDDATMVEILTDILEEPAKKSEDGVITWFCGSWSPMMFDVIWDTQKNEGRTYGDFKFKNITDFRIFQKEFYKYKRQNKKNLDEQKKFHDVGSFMYYKIAQFALTYCDYTDEEKEKIKTYCKNLIKE